MDHQTSDTGRTAPADTAAHDRIPSPAHQLGARTVLRNWVLMLSGFIAIALLAQWVSG